MVKGVLIDLAGVVYSGGDLLPGAKAAIAGLEAAKIPYRFITNTTSRPLRAILAQLEGFGLNLPPAIVFTPAQAAVAWLAAHGHAPHLLVHPALEEDFAACRRDGPPAVVVGDAREHFTFARLNAAFRLLIAGAPLVALAQNRMFRDADGELSLDAGAFVKALEFSSGVKALVIGKPEPAFFAAAAESMGLRLAEVAMIGDDAEADVAGALAAGAGMAVLVHTGKYRDGDEDLVRPRPSAVVAGIAEAVDAVLGDKG